jgi:hypothetical protein
MSIEIVTWDLPPEENMNEYMEKSKGWITTTLSV